MATQGNAAGGDTPDEVRTGAEAMLGAVSEVESEALQVVQRPLCGRNSCGWLVVDIGSKPLGLDVFDRLTMLEGFVASASMLPTTLVAAFTTLPTTPVAWSMALLNSCKIPDIMAPVSNTEATGATGLTADKRLAASPPTLFAILVPSPNKAPATLLTSPNRPAIAGETALSSGFVLGIASRTVLLTQGL